MTLTQARAAFPSAFSIIPPFRPVTLLRPLRSFIPHTMSPSRIARMYTTRWNHTREQPHAVTFTPVNHVTVRGYTRVFCTGDAGDHVRGSQEKSLTARTRFIFETNAAVRPQIYHVNADALLSSLRIRRVLSFSYYPLWKMERARKWKKNAVYCKISY